MNRIEKIEFEKTERRLLEAKKLIDLLKEAIGRRDSEIYALRQELKALGPRPETHAGSSL